MFSLRTNHDVVQKVVNRMYTRRYKHYVHGVCGDVPQLRTNGMTSALSVNRTPLMGFTFTPTHIPEESEGSPSRSIPLGSTRAPPEAPK